MDIFACAKGNTASKVKEERKGAANASTRSRSISPEKEDIFVKDMKMEIVGELAKLMTIYRASNERGKVMGYQRAISNIKAYGRPITSAD